LACKFGTIVMNDLPGDPKSMDDMIFNEVDYIGVLTSASGATFVHFEK